MRTDQTLVCAPCRVRFARAAGHCPDCGANGLDLRDPLSLTQALTLLGAARPRFEPMLALQSGLRVAGEGVRRAMVRMFHRPGDGEMSRLWLVPGAIGGVFFFLAFPTPTKAAVVMAIALGMVGAICSLMFAVIFVIALYMAMYGLLYVPLRAQLAVLRRLELFVLRQIDASGANTLRLAPMPPRGADEVVRGRVRCSAPMTSPGGVVCVAWRAVGEGPSGPIDDAGGVGFALEGADGAVDVDLAAGATIDVPVTGAMTWLDRAQALTLGAISVGDGATRVREGVIREGDDVEIAGPWDLDTEAAGYRGVSYRRRYRERPGGAPVLVRRARSE